jgi:CheY-like chemotaxis protein
MDVTPGEIKLGIQDFGKGVKLSKSGSANRSVERLGVGMQGMRERMRQLGGKLEITSSPNKGTLVAATIPLSSLAAIPAQSSTVMVSSSSNLAYEVAGPVGNTLRKRIPLADDHEMLRRGVRNTL